MPHRLTIFFYLGKIPGFLGMAHYDWVMHTLLLFTIILYKKWVSEYSSKGQEYLQEFEDLN